MVQRPGHLRERQRVVVVELNSDGEAEHHHYDAEADRRQEILQPAKPGIPIDGLNIRHVLAIPDYGYFVLQRANQAWTGTVYAITDQPLAHCWLQGRSVNCRSASR